MVNDKIILDKLCSSIVVPNPVVDALIFASNQLNLGIHGYRVIYCFLCALRHEQIIKMGKPLAIKEISQINEERKKIGLFLIPMTLSSVEDFRQQDCLKKLEKIKQKYPISKITKIIIPTKMLRNDGRLSVSSNTVFSNVFVKLERIFQKTNKIATKNLIVNLTYHKSQRYIVINISNELLWIFMDATIGYIPVRKELFFENKTIFPLLLKMYLHRKFFQTKGGVISIKKLVKDLTLPKFYQSPERMNVLLKHSCKTVRLRDGLDVSHEIINKSIKFVLKKSEILPNHNIQFESKSTITNSLKYLKKSRKLSGEQIKVMRNCFIHFGISKMKNILRSPSLRGITGDEYYRTLMLECSSRV